MIDIDIHICMISYQQEPYIRECLNSILSQRTEYTYQIIAGDDGSTDGTYEIIKEYAQSYPDKIKVLSPNTNDNSPSPIANYIRTLGACTAPFVAVCDGDDYWTDPQKLQNQVHFLKHHPEYALCYHPVSVWSAGKEQPDDITVPDIPADSEILHLAEYGNYIHTCSCVGRNILHIDPIPAQAASSALGDYFMYMWVARHGRIMRLPEVMGRYRVHNHNYWSTLSMETRRTLTIQCCELLLETGRFSPEVERALQRQISRLEAQNQSQPIAKAWWKRFLP